MGAKTTHHLWWLVSFIDLHIAYLLVDFDVELEKHPLVSGLGLLQLGLPVAILHLLGLRGSSPQLGVVLPQRLLVARLLLLVLLGNLFENPIVLSLPLAFLAIF